MYPHDALSSFQSRLASVVRPESLVEDAASLEGYNRDISFATGGSARLMIYPENKDQVQGIVRLASETGVPLVPVSSGAPHFYGGTVPGRDGAIVNFSRMKRIIRIDPVSRYAMIEPGVTYGELIPKLKELGLRLSLPLLPQADKSVATSRLEREPTLIPKYQYDYVDPLLTMEVVYGTGDDFRTGSASGPGSLETLKADKVNPWGPGTVDFFRFVSGAQGTMGLVTWIVTKAEVLPSLQKLYFIPADDVRVLATAMNNLLQHRVVDECLALNNVNIAAILAERWPEDYRELKGRLPSWTVIVVVAGYQRRAEERVGIQEKHLLNICGDLGLKPQTTLPGVEGVGARVLKLLSNAWDKEPCWKLLYKKACHDIFFLTPLSKAPKFIEIMPGIAARHHYAHDDIGCYLQPVVQGRGCHVEFNIPCDSSDAGETAMVRELFLDASATFMENGAFFSRPYGPWAGMVYKRDSGDVNALRKLKDIFDPNHILNPGKLCFQEVR